jgi:hypothetical protein
MAAAGAPDWNGATVRVLHDDARVIHDVAGSA